MASSIGQLNRGLKIYAIVETGGKQYKVTSGQVIDVERLDVAEGGTVEIDRVLLIADGDKVTVGTPTVDGAKVLATSQGDDRSKKVIVFKYKNKTISSIFRLLSDFLLIKVAEVNKIR